jgi:hypothetical protein
VTTKKLVVVKEGKFLSNLISKLVLAHRIKRETSLKKITGITMNRFGRECLIHIKGEHDIRFVSEEY